MPPFAHTEGCTGYQECTPHADMVSVSSLLQLSQALLISIRPRLILSLPCFVTLSLPLGLKPSQFFFACGHRTAMCPTLPQL